MHGFLPGLFDRLDADDEQLAPNHRSAASRAAERCRLSITGDLEALLNTRSAILPTTLASYPAVAGSVVNYGLIDFAGMCMTSDTDQQRIGMAVRLAIERHEPRLNQVAVTLQPGHGAINRVEFVITAKLNSAAQAEPLSFNAVFRPALQQYCIESSS